ncbi:hypothetical protein V1264_024595 [Littorina saxatilis]|uniref:Uncharacterized protein n=2 Tax=Littorina saxatilis TaxID=31220 RepID=A0AAN9FZ02_9CAEN
MCDCFNPKVHFCNYTSSSCTTCDGSGISSDDSSAIITTTTTITSSVRSDGSVASTSSESPTYLLSQVTLSPNPHSSLGQELLSTPEHDREEREPTPIPPDRLIVTQLPTGSSVLVGMYKGNIHPPVHPVPSHVAGRKGETETNKEKDKRKDQKETQKDKLKSGAGQSNVPFVKRPGESAFTREQQQQPQQQPPGSSAKSGATEALFFDPVNQELVHVKRFKPGPNPEPARSRSAVMEPHRGKWATREPPRRSPSPGPKSQERENRAGAKLGEKQKAHSASALYASIADDPERELVYQYFRELAFVLCLLTFLGLLFKVRPHIFVGAVLGVHLALFFSRKYIFIRKPIAK